MDVPTSYYQVLMQHLLPVVGVIAKMQFQRRCCELLCRNLSFAPFKFLVDFVAISFDK